MALSLTRTGAPSILVLPTATGAEIDGHRAACLVSAAGLSREDSRNLTAAAGCGTILLCAAGESRGADCAPRGGSRTTGGAPSGQRQHGEQARPALIRAARDERRRRPRVGTLTGGEWCVRRRASRPVVHGVVAPAPGGRCRTHERASAQPALGLVLPESLILAQEQRWRRA